MTARRVAALLSDSRYVNRPRSSETSETSIAAEFNRRSPSVVVEVDRLRARSGFERLVEFRSYHLAGRNHAAEDVRLFLVAAGEASDGLSVASLALRLRTPRSRPATEIDRLTQHPPPPLGTYR